jgi:hypothetical protein
MEIKGREEEAGQEKETGRKKMRVGQYLFHGTANS